MYLNYFLHLPSVEHLTCHVVLSSAETEMEKKPEELSRCLSLIPPKGRHELITL